MLRINPSTLLITCPQGDTGMFTLTITDSYGQALSQPLTGVAIFAVCQRVSGVYAKIASTHVTLVNNTATIRITNEFSRSIPAGSYYWDVRIVTDPAYDSNNDVICDDDTDEVHSLYAARPEGMPQYVVPGVAINV